MAKKAAKKPTKKTAKKAATEAPEASGAGSAGRASGRRSGSGYKAGAASGKQLVIVESPSKAKTINKYLGSDYVVLASVGHVRDLPSKAAKGDKSPVPGVILETNFAWNGATGGDPRTAWRCSHREEDELEPVQHQGHAGRQGLDLEARHL